jgi:ABC-type glycerol-3-phosphate transport system permease component
MIVPFALLGPAVFAARQFMLGLPTEYIEAARLDGASELDVFRRIVVPLSGPAITTVAVLTFLFSWNLFLWPLAIMSSQGNFTAPLGLSLLGLGSTFRPDYEIWMAAAVLSTLPPLIFFLILERPYMRGLESLSGLKG